MTDTPANDDKAPAKYPDHLLVTDAELLRRLGMPENDGRTLLRQLDAKPGSGFPKKIQLWGNRRYWPAVKEYFDVNYGLQQPELRRQRA